MNRDATSTGERVPGVDTTPDRLEILLAGYLRKYCVGVARARTQGRIARDLRDLGLAVSAREVRDAVARLRMRGCCVGTGPRGVFLCLAPDDWRVAFENLLGRLRTQGRGLKVFRETWRRAAAGQSLFDFAEGLDAYRGLVAAPLLAGLGLPPGPERAETPRIPGETGAMAPAPAAAVKGTSRHESAGSEGRTAGKTGRVY